MGDSLPIWVFLRDWGQVWKCSVCLVGYAYLLYQREKVHTLEQVCNFKQASSCYDNNCFFVN